MKRLFGFYGTAIGKKAVMAITGLIFWGFVLTHMLGNLKMFAGADGINHYAHWLRELAAPAVPHSGVLWVLRLVLLAALALHVHSALTLTAMNRSARKVGYRNRETIQAGFSSRTMRLSGILLLLFIIYHILHMTTGTLHTDFVPGDVFHNVLAAFSKIWVVAIYVLAAVLVGMHLHHGLWSLFQSLGWNHPKYNPLRRGFAIAFSLLIGIGFAIPPLMVFFRVIR